LVLPTLPWVVGPLPFLIALAALFAIGRVTRGVGAGRLTSAFARNADVVWCVAGLALKPFLLVHDALLEPTGRAYWLIAVAALAPPVLAMMVLPRRARIWTLLVASAFASLILAGDVVYYRFFDDVLSTPALLATRQTTRVWGSVRSLLTFDLLWLVIDLPVATLALARLARRPMPEPSVGARLVWTSATVAGLVLCGLPFTVFASQSTAPLDQMFRNRAVMEQLGPFGYHAYDSWNYARATWLRPAVTTEQVDEAVSWFAKRSSLRAGSRGRTFGAARGKNLIVVQVESLQDFVVDYQIGGQEVMPHLRHWSENSLRLTNVTDETNEGRTSDAEFTTMTSLLPLDHGAVAFRYPGNHYTALPAVLSDHGYATVSAVAFEPGFWNRKVMHPSYGFGHSFFEPDFVLTEQIGWGLNDRDFLQQMVPRLEQLPRPFAAWLITLSLHHPFDDFPDNHKILKLGTLERTPFGNYLHTMRFFDQALEDFRTALARDGLLETSVIVVFGDHDSGFSRSEALTKAIGIDNTDEAWELNDRVPWFIRVPSATDTLRGVSGMPAGQTDFAPTLLAVLGIDPAPLPYLGRNLLDWKVGVPSVPVPRPYGDWLDDHHLFLVRGTNRVCYGVLDRAETATEACQAADGVARGEREVSKLVVTDDLQQRIHTRLEAIVK
ncbi:MAG TPA: LTA synthase family protein, partial [Vicinamibacterales bacterium]|nr:LTA synthase family protein [Vicinamibacterales bacterium]